MSTNWEKKESEVPQLCLTLCEPMDYTVHGVLQARILEWLAIPFSSSQPREQSQLILCRQILYQMSHKGSPRILEWVAFSFSREIFLIQKLDWGLLHCRWILYQLAIREAPFTFPGKGTQNTHLWGWPIRRGGIVSGKGCIVDWVHKGGLIK